MANTDGPGKVGTTTSGGDAPQAAEEVYGRVQAQLETTCRNYLERLTAGSKELETACTGAYNGYIGSLNQALADLGAGLSTAIKTYLEASASSWSEGIEKSGSDEPTEAYARAVSNLSAETAKQSERATESYRRLLSNVSDATGDADPEGRAATAYAEFVKDLGDSLSQREPLERAVIAGNSYVESLRNQQAAAYQRLHAAYEALQKDVEAAWRGANLEEVLGAGQLQLAQTFQNAWIDLQRLYVEAAQTATAEAQSSWREVQAAPRE